MATFTHILVKRHSEYAKLPTLSYDDSAGMDLYAAETVTIPAFLYLLEKAELLPQI